MLLNNVVLDRFEFVILVVLSGKVSILLERKFNFKDKL
jgi:hypothetical protein